MFDIYVATHVPDFNATPAKYAVAAAYCDEMTKKTAFNDHIAPFDFNFDPQALWFWAIVSACALIKKFKEEHPEVSSDATYTIHVPDPEVYRLVTNIEMGEFVENKPFYMECCDVRKAVSEVAPGRISFAFLADNTIYGYRKAKMQADLVFIEKVSKELCYPDSTLVIPMQDLNKPFYRWDLGNGQAITSSKASPYDEGKITTGFDLSTPSHYSFTLFRSIVVKDRHIPRDGEKDKRQRTERKAWKTHKKEVKTEFLKKLRSE